MLNLEFSLEEPFSLFRFLLEKWVLVDSHLFTQDHTLVRCKRSWLLNGITFHSSLTELPWAFSLLTQKITLIRCQIFWLLNFTLALLCTSLSFLDSFSEHWLFLFSSRDHYVWKQHFLYLMNMDISRKNNIKELIL